MPDSGIVKPRPKRKGRPRPLPPDVTARNLAIEKQRREALNENFVVCFIKRAIFPRRN
jgi:hypothetical protein